MSSFYPSIEHLLAATEEDELLLVRPAVLHEMPLIILLAATMLLTVLINSYISVLRPNTTLSGTRWLACIPLAILLEITRRHLNHKYLLTRDSVIQFSGRLSLQYRVPSAKLEDIRGIRVEQPFWGRVFNYGNILIGTAAQDNSEVLLQGVPAPHELAKLIEDLRNNVQEADTSHHNEKE